MNIKSAPIDVAQQSNHHFHPTQKDARVKCTLSAHEKEGVMKHYFQVTYSVHPNGDSEKEEKAAASVRKELRDVPGWKTVDKIETVLVGVMELAAPTRDGKRTEAQQIAEKKIKKVVDELDVYSDVWVYVSLMVDQLGPHIEFSL